MSSGLSESSGSGPVNGCSAPERTSVVLPEPLGPATIQNQGGIQETAGESLDRPVRTVPSG